MSRVFIIRKQQLFMFALIGLAAWALIAYVGGGSSDEAASVHDEHLAVPASAPEARAAEGDEAVIHMVTGEFTAQTKDGGKIEAYRWDPGTVFVEKGQKVTMHIYGVNGVNHPFIIEGLNVKGEVKQGQETVVEFQPQEEGIYRMICLTHPDAEQSGPMIAYIVVD